MMNSKLNQILRMAGVVAIFAIFREVGRNHREAMEDRKRQDEVRAKIYGELQRALVQFQETPSVQNRTKLESLVKNLPEYPRPGITDLYTKTMALEALAFPRD